MEMSSELYTIRFSKFERLKYDNFVENSEFKSLAELIREALNVYISNPDIRNPVREITKLDDALKGFDLYMDRKEREEREILNIVTKNSNRLGTLEIMVKLLLKNPKIDERSIKQAERKDTSMEDIYDD